jgi:hypothetical protein
MEAAKSVYEAVAARLNVEDEIGDAGNEEIESRPAASPPPVVSREEISRLLQAHEPPARETPAPAPAPPAAQEPTGFTAAERDLIRRHLESRGAAPPAAPAPQAPAAKRGSTGGLSEEDRRLIEEHLRRRMEAERQNS